MVSGKRCLHCFSHTTRLPGVECLRFQRTGMSRLWYWLPPVICCCLAVWLGYRFAGNHGDQESTRNRFDSFAPPRDDCRAKWYVDGQDYMAAVANAIEAASKEIFIADWQISPHIFMKRPDTGVDSLKWRLDQMLLKKAEEGIRIYILLYWESKEVADMDLGSAFAQSTLEHQNIKVLRHPDLSTMLRYGFEGTGWWTHHEKVVVVDRSIAFVGGIDLCFGRWDTHNHELTDNYAVHPCATEKGNCDSAQGEAARYSRWIGKDYGNTFVGGSRTELDLPMVDYVNRSQVPRMPWHDVACSFTGRPAHDVAKHFIQRYNSVGDEDQLHFGNFDMDHKFSDPGAHNVRVQVLRSVDQWSAGQRHEASIQNAYLHAIESAEHFIYIENQFFISSQPGTFYKVTNKIMSALADRIVRAYEKNEDFHVMIVMPLKPEFPGDWDTDDGKDLRAVSYWNYVTLYSGEDSLYSSLEKGGIPQEDIHSYITVYGLRTHATLNDKLVTEIVYVHSKLMIVDDRVAIIGSANINDRSMLGSRDSEVAVILEDTDLVEGKMKGQAYNVGKFSHTLRCHLMREHLGLLDTEMNEASSQSLKVEDPLIHSADIWRIAVENTLAYERVFRGRITPTNNVWNLEDLRRWRSVVGLAEFDPDGGNEELSKIRGRLVMYPVLFLWEVLEPSYLDIMGVHVDSRGIKRKLNFDKPEKFYF